MVLFGKIVQVPVIDVNSENILEIWPSLCLAIKTACYIGVDTELSGLGDRKVLNAKSIEDRYKGLSSAAKSRSILSLGISCFKIQSNVDDGSKSKWSYHVQTFNIMVLCSENYTVEPASLKFLVDHNFDFNRQYATGVPYYRGNDKDNSSLNSPCVRGILSLIVHREVPLVFHNALVDLIFIYENFYASLPTKLTSFIADLSEMFPGGLFDTKYMTDFIERIEASYLQYVFLHCQRANQHDLSEMNREVYIEFSKYPTDYLSVGYHQSGFITRTWSDLEVEKLRSNICLCFAAHGWCGKPRVCTLIHDVALILSTGYLLTAKQRRSRKRNRNRKQKGDDNKSEKEIVESENDSVSPGINDIEILPTNDHISSPVKRQKVKAEVDTKCENNKNGDSVENTELCEENVKRTKIYTEENNPENNDENVDIEILTNNISDISEQSMCNSANDLRSTDTTGKHNRDSSSDLNTSERNEQKTTLSSARSGCHRAGFDAFMTASIFSVFIAKHNNVPDTNNIKLHDLNVNNLKDKIYLSGKDIPLIISKSSFSKTSPDHKVKLEKLQHCGL